LKEQLEPPARESADRALAIMKGWQWVRYDPDGMPFANSLDLSTAISRLAYHGHSDPKSALLDLFCEGAIQATADYHWAKNQNGDDYRLEGNHAIVEPVRWLGRVDKRLKP
jgi:hypothetical protein